MYFSVVQGYLQKAVFQDFRSETGIYNTVHKYGCSPEQILSHTFFMRKPEIFYDFYKSTMVYREAEPNEAHKALAKLEKIGKLKAVVTQNIDGLHQKAGSEKVYELHGTIMKNYCMKCGQFYDLDYVMLPRVCRDVRSAAVW